MTPTRRLSTLVPLTWSPLKKTWTWKLCWISLLLHHFMPQLKLQENIHQQNALPPPEPTQPQLTAENHNPEVDLTMDEPWTRSRTFSTTYCTYITDGTLLQVASRSWIRSPLPYYLPAGPEDFRAHRLRHAQQETMSYGPLRGRRYALGPYANPTSSSSPTTPTTEEHAAFCEAFDLSSLDQNELPCWMDLLMRRLAIWVSMENYKTIGKSSPDAFFDITWSQEERCSVWIKPEIARFLRIALIVFEWFWPATALVALESTWMAMLTQNHINNRPEEEQWTGTTAFQINAATRREMGMYGNLSASQVIKKQKSYEQKKVKKDGSINERNLTAEERAKFMEAKVKELKSFFENGVWEFSSTTVSDESRTLSSRMILKWSKHADGSPRAKARLIVRGYADKDALEGKVDTAAPNYEPSQPIHTAVSDVNFEVEWLDSRCQHGISTRTSSRTQTLGETTTGSTHHLGRRWKHPNAFWRSPATASWMPHVVGFWKRAVDWEP